MDGRWETPFEVSAPGELGPHEFDQDVERVLVRTDMRQSALVHTATAGIVGALVQVATEAYAVISVVPPEGASRATAIAAAHEVASMWEVFDHRSSVSLFDLPLGGGPDWSIEETEFEDLIGPTRRERSTVYIPAWDVEQPGIDLLGNPGYGFLAAIPLFEARLKPVEEGYIFEAAQSAKARFHRFGFTAAAGTAFMGVFGASPSKPHRIVERHLRLRFRRPFAAVAVAKSPRQYQHTRGIPVPHPQGPHPWDGVPCFSAWVTRPTEVAPAVPGDVQEPWSELMDLAEPAPPTAHGMLDWLRRKPV